MYLLEVTATVDAQTITALFVGIVAVLTAYGTLQQKKVASKVEEVAVKADVQANVTNDIHSLVNGHTTALDNINKALRLENAALRAGKDPPETPVQ